MLAACRVVVLEKMRMGLGDNMMENLERFLLLVSQENVMNSPDASLTAAPGLDWTADRLTKLGTAIYKLIQGYTDKAILLTSELLSWVTHFTLQVRGNLCPDHPHTHDMHSCCRGACHGRHQLPRNSLDDLRAARNCGAYVRWCTVCMSNARVHAAHVALVPAEPPLRALAGVRPT